MNITGAEKAEYLEPAQLYDFYKVEKMRFCSREDKSVIQYNDNIILFNTPLEAYGYIVNGKSPLNGLWSVIR